MSTSRAPTRSQSGTARRKPLNAGRRRGFISRGTAANSIGSAVGNPRSTSKRWMLCASLSWGSPRTQRAT
eukprot:2778795-Pyramimonas_sp.AAC.1